MFNRVIKISKNDFLNNKTSYLISKWDKRLTEICGTIA